MARSEGIRATRALFSLAGADASRPEGRPLQSSQPIFEIDADWIARRTNAGIERLFPVADVELTGRHMLNNVLAATAVSSIAGVAPAAMTQALRGFHGLEHVMEPAGEFEGVRFVNDSKATNVEAAKRSIEAFERGVVAIVGGKFKGGDLRELRAPLAARGRAVVAIGEAAPLVVEALTGTVPVIQAASMKEAVRRGYEAASPDGVVLLAPACASFDWFRDYAERGRTFKYEVQRLKERSRC
jgi:UDP-N-acetylmuramoylalanine--D-glutamate ligase